MTSLSLGYNTLLVKSIKSIFLLVLILLVRKPLNVKGTKRANMVLWGVLFAFLLVPRTLLITIEDLHDYGIWQGTMKVMIWFRDLTGWFEKGVGNGLTVFNRFFIAGLILIYIIRQVIKTNHVLKHSTPLVPDERMEDCLRQFPLKRKVELLLNDKVGGPITYGILRPKIVLQSDVLADDELLQYVLFHELTHIANWDMVWTHVKHLVVCLHWFNPLVWIAAKYLEDDLEMRCDKLVLDKVDDTAAHRQAYCLSMLKLVECPSGKKSPVLSLHPTMERMMVMKKWKQSVWGSVMFILVLLVTTTAFADVRVIDPDPVTLISGTPEQAVINENGCAAILTDEEYEAIYGTEESGMRPMAANVSESVTLRSGENKQYKFDMSPSTGVQHDGFTVRISNLQSSGDVDYTVKVYENGRVIYRESFAKAVNFSVRADRDSSYIVMINNFSISSLTLNVEINSYRR